MMHGRYDICVLTSRCFAAEIGMASITKFYA